MTRLIVVVTTVCFISVLCSQSAWMHSLQVNARNYQPGWCTVVPGVDAGSEDIQVLPNGLAFITSGLGGKKPGKILLFDFWKPRCGAHALDIIGDLDRDAFSPIGVNIWKDSNRNIVYIFVINYNGNNKKTVEKFRFDEKRRTLYHLRTYQDDRTFTQLDDLVVTGEDSFYFTNYIKSDFFYEFRRRLPLGNVGFYDGTKGRILLTDLCIPNGIAKSSDGKYVYVAITGEERVNVYARKSDNTLKLMQVVPLCSLVDNIDVDVVTGDLWVVGHADADLLMKHMKPPYTSISPSQVFRLSVSDGGSRVTHVEEVHYIDGRQMSGATVAVHYRRLMLIGSVFTNMLLCEARHS